MFLAAGLAYNLREFDITRTTSASPAHRAASASNATSHPVLAPWEGAGQPRPRPPNPRKRGVETPLLVQIP